MGFTRQNVILKNIFQRNLFINAILTKMETKQFQSRRQFIKTAGVGAVLIGLQPAVNEIGSKTSIASLPAIGFEQTPLSYHYKALEPVIDALTMEIHYTKHAAGYTKNLADALTAEKVNTTEISLEALLGMISKYSAKMRNNAGGHYNHELFWKSMTPVKGTQPSNQFLQTIRRDFDSLEALKTQFSDAAKNRFGSGWAWLYLDYNGKLKIGSTPNQDNPMMDLSDIKGYPLLGLDVWEHAYYLKYQNRRGDYVQAFWDVVNWEFISARFEAYKH